MHDALYYNQILRIFQKSIWLYSWLQFLNVYILRTFYVIFSAVKRLIMINRIQNKSFCLHNICVHNVYIYYVSINTNTCMYIFKKNMLCLYVQYIYI